MSRLEIIISILKLLTILLSGLFGTIGLLTDYRDKQSGKITKWGKRALIGVVASCLVLGAIQAGELLQQANQRASATQTTLEQLQKQERILSEINRDLNPLNNVRASFTFLSVRLDHPYFSTYVARVQREAAALAARWKKSPELKVRGTTPTWEGPLRPQGSNVVGFITFRRTSPLFPSRIAEPAAYFLLDAVSNGNPVQIAFFKTPAEFSHYPFASAPDVTMTFKEDSSSPETLAVTYDLRNGTFRIYTGKLITDPGEWSSTGKIASLLDLAGAQALIDIPSVQPEGLRPELDDVRLWVGTAVPIVLTNDQLKQHSYEHGIVYQYIFPSNLDDLRREGDASQVEVRVN